MKAGTGSQVGAITGSATSAALVHGPVCCSYSRWAPLHFYSRIQATCGRCRMNHIMAHSALYWLASMPPRKASQLYQSDE